MSLEQQEAALDLTDAIATARSGLKSDVARLVEQLHEGAFFLPLARSIPGLEEGDTVNVDEEITLSPHMLVDADDQLFVALFTREEFIGPVKQAMEWKTDDHELEYCGLPAALALKIAYDACGNEEIVGAVVNASQDTELVLHKDELGHLTQGQAIPFVAYVEGAESESEDAESVDIAESELPPDFKGALDECVAKAEHVIGYSVRRTFDPERDREPHLALRFTLDEPAESYEELRHVIVGTLEGTVPAPGYVDILFAPVSGSVEPETTD